MLKSKPGIIGTSMMSRVMYCSDVNVVVNICMSEGLRRQPLPAAHAHSCVAIIDWNDEAPSTGQAVTSNTVLFVFVAYKLGYTLFIKN